jgi:NAD(P)H-dependent FMN reductase
MKIIAISGSLRVGSGNTAVLRAATRLAPAGVSIELFDGIADLPSSTRMMKASGSQRALARCVT